MDIGIYVAYLMSSPSGSSCVKASNVLTMSHDAVNRFLSSGNFTGKDLFKSVYKSIDLYGGTLSADDSVLDIQVTYGSCATGDTLTVTRNSTNSVGGVVRWRRGVAAPSVGALNVYSAALPQAPADAGNPTATVSPGQVALAWSDRSNTEAGFIVERAAASGPFLPVAALLAGTTAYQDTSVTAATLYSYRIRSINARGSGLSATTVSVTAQ